MEDNLETKKMSLWYFAIYFSFFYEYVDGFTFWYLLCLNCFLIICRNVYIHQTDFAYFAPTESMGRDVSLYHCQNLHY